MVGHADSQGLVGRLVAGGVAREDDDVLAFGHVGVVVGGPAVPAPSFSITFVVTPSGVR